MARWFKIIFLSLALVGAFSSAAHAVDWGSVARGAQRMLGRAPQIPLPAGCREEACRSAGPVLAGSLDNCRRYICGGNFWGESAVDLLCPGIQAVEGDGNNRRTYEVCQTRTPSREYASEQFSEIRFQLSGPPEGFCGGFKVDEEKDTEDHSDLSFLFLPEAFGAVTDVIHRFPMEWSPDEALAVANTLALVLQRIDEAIRQNRIDEVGEVNTEFRDYINLARDTTALGIYFLINYANYHSALENNRLNLYLPNCPEQFADICSVLTYPTTYWINRGGCGSGLDWAAGCAYGNQIKVVWVSGIETDLVRLSTIYSHELGHIVYHHRINRPPRMSRLDRALDSYATETTSYLIDSIVGHFLPPELADGHGWVGGSRGATYNLLRTEGASRARRNSYDTAYLMKDFEDILGTTLLNDLITSDGQYRDLRARGYTGPVITFRMQLDNLFQLDGGIGQIINGHVSSIALNSSLHHDYIASPLGAGPGTPPNLTVGPPPENVSYSPHPRLGYVENQPNYTEPDHSREFPSECLAFLSGGTDSGRNCYDLCWNNCTYGSATSGSSAYCGLCENRMHDDLNAGCGSGNSSCHAERERQRRTEEAREQRRQEREEEERQSQSSGSGGGSGGGGAPHPNRPCRGTTMSGVSACGTCQWNASANQYQMVSNACQNQDWNTCCPACSPPTPSCLSCSGGWCGSGATGGGGTATSGGYGGGESGGSGSGGSSGSGDNGSGGDDNVGGSGGNGSGEVGGGGRSGGGSNGSGGEGPSEELTVSIGECEINGICYANCFATADLNERWRDPLASSIPCPDRSQGQSTSPPSGGQCSQWPCESWRVDGSLFCGQCCDCFNLGTGSICSFNHLGNDPDRDPFACHGEMYVGYPCYLPYDYGDGCNFYLGPGIFYVPLGRTGAGGSTVPGSTQSICLVPYTGDGWQNEGCAVDNRS